MAKNGLINVTANNTFQVWLDRTNELVDLMGSDVITASVSGDTTGALGAPKTSTLIGTFSANTFIANTRLRADKIGTIPGSTDITLEAPTIVNAPTRVAFQAFSSSVDPVIRINNDSVAWDVGFDDDSQSFIINTGVASERFKLTTAGNLSVAGSITAGTGGFVGSVTGNVTGDVTGNVTGNVTGDVTGTVSDISNHDTDDLVEGTNQYFTTARARASLSGSTGVTYNSSTGTIAIGQAVATTSDVTFNSITSGDFKTGNWEIDADGNGNLCFYYNGNLKFRMNTSGGFVAEGDLTAFGGI